MSQIVFGPDPALTTLPANIQSCLTGAPSETCDQLIGSLAQGYNATTGGPFCASPQYKTTTYCACVNNSVPCPQTTMSACANTAFAYKPYAWSVAPAPGAASPNEECKASNNCLNIIQVSGSQNVTSSINQSCGGGEAPNNIIVSTFISYPYITILLFFMIILLCIAIFIHTEDVEQELILQNHNGTGRS
jgi:hypothetical protein